MAASDPAGRLGTIALGWGNRICGVVVALVTTPLLLRSLGADRYSAFQLVQAFTPWLALATLGTGPALKNLIAGARAGGAPDADYRSAAGRALAWATGLTAAALLLAAPLAAGQFFGRLAVDVGEATRALQAGGVLLLLVGAGTVGTEALFGEQRARLAYVLGVVGIVLRLALVAAAAWLAPPRHALLLLTVAYLAPTAAAGVAGLLAAGVRPGRAAPPPRRALARGSRPFLANAAVAAAVNNVDYFVMSQVLDGRAIATYAVVMMVVSVLQSAYTTVLLVEWPRWTAGFCQGRDAEVRGAVGRLARLGVGAGLAATLGAALLLPAVLRLWLGSRAVEVGTATVLLFFGYLTIRLWTDTYTAGLQAESRAGYTARVALVQAFITGPAEYVLGRALGMNGIVLGLIAGQLLTAAWMNPWCFVRGPARPAELAA